MKDVKYSTANITEIASTSLLVTTSGLNYICFLSDYVLEDKTYLYVYPVQSSSTAPPHEVASCWLTEGPTSVTQKQTENI